MLITAVNNLFITFVVTQRIIKIYYLNLPANQLRFYTWNFKTETDIKTILWNISFFTLWKGKKTWDFLKFLMVYKWIIEKRSAAVTYKLGSIIRNYILGSKNIVDSIYIDEEVSFSLNIDLCVSEKSNFYDPYKKYVITWGLRFIENKILGKLLS